jgi:exosortase/archaeosortase family protein
MAQRATDGSTDPWELISLATAATFIWQRRNMGSSHRINLAAPIALLLLYAASYQALPHLCRAIIAVLVVGACINAAYFGQRMPLALWGLLLLSVPLIASFNFYLGYPLRVLAGSATAALLQMNGFSVLREGTLLAWNGHTIAVDAPCSGIKMLWTGCYLSCTLAAMHRLSFKATLSLCLLGFIAVIASNILRATALFYVEADIIALPKEWHSLVGIAVFILTAISMMLLAKKISEPRHAH